MRLPVYAIVALLAFVSRPLVAAGLLVSPTQLGLAGRPGETVSGVISVMGSRVDTRVRTSISDFALDLDGRPYEIPSEKAPRSLKSWMNVDQRELVATPGAGVPLVVTVTIPKTATGSYWAAVGVEIVPDAAPRVPRRLAMRIVPRLSIPVILNVGDSNARIDVKPVELTADADPSSKVIHVSATVENVGSTAVLISGAFALEQGNGATAEEIASADVGPVTSLPGSRVRVKQSIPWAAGKDGQVHAYLRYGTDATQIIELTTKVALRSSG